VGPSRRLSNLPLNGRDVGEAEHDFETPDLETSSPEYAERFRGAVGAFFLEVQSRTLLDLLAPWPAADVLDVGGGHAQTAGTVVASGRKLTVAGSGDAARVRLDRLLPPGSFGFERCDLLALPFPDRSFDVTLAFRLIPHVRRWTVLIGELCRVTRHAVIVDYPDWRSFNVVSAVFFGWKKAVERNTRPFQCFHAAEIRGAFARHGFTSPIARGQFFLPMALHRAVGSAGITRFLEGASGVLGLTGAFGSPVILRVVRNDTGPEGGHGASLPAGVEELQT
jgi:Methyltransferase domain